MTYKLGVNIDHIATLRNARGEGYPNLLELALLAKKAGANQITMHLREDRRHIKDEDLFLLKKSLMLPINMEMAATDEMLEIACQVIPYAVCLVPEKRNEVTTEGGLDVIRNYQELVDKIKILKSKGILVSIFVDSIKDQIEACANLKADAIEINTGKYANLKGELKAMEVLNIQEMAKYANQVGMKCHCGHGLNLDNIAEVAKIKEVVEYNIGHFLVSYALIVGFENSIKQMNTAIGFYKQ